MWKLFCFFFVIFTTYVCNVRIKKWLPEAQMAKEQLTNIEITLYEWFLCEEKKMGRRFVILVKWQADGSDF